MHGSLALAAAQQELHVDGLWAVDRLPRGSFRFTFFTTRQGNPTHAIDLVAHKAAVTPAVLLATEAVHGKLARAALELLLPNRRKRTMAPDFLDHDAQIDRVLRIAIADGELMPWDVAAVLAVVMDGREQKLALTRQALDFLRRSIAAL